VVCRQLGYDHGAVHVEHGNVSYADLASVSTEALFSRGIDCTGQFSY
jgi:hypothetical protein